MSTSTQATPVAAVNRFSASETGAWSNSYLLSDGEEALHFLQRTGLGGRGRGRGARGLRMVDAGSEQQ